MLIEYRIIIAKRAEKFLKSVPKYDQCRILNEIELLSKNPRKHGVIKLVGTSDPIEYRTRQGNYRIIFEIQDEIFLVTIIDICLRNERSYK